MALVVINVELASEPVTLPTIVRSSEIPEQSASLHVKEAYKQTPEMRHIRDSASATGHGSKQIHRTQNHNKPLRRDREDDEDNRPVGKQHTVCQQNPEDCARGADDRNRRI